VETEKKWKKLEKIEKKCKNYDRNAHKSLQQTRRYKISADMIKIERDRVKFGN